MSIEKSVKSGDLKLSIKNKINLLKSLDIKL